MNKMEPYKNIEHNRKPHIGVFYVKPNVTMFLVVQEIQSLCLEYIHPPFGVRNLKIYFVISEQLKGSSWDEARKLIKN